METRWDNGDPAFEPLREAGEGESEGFEEAERALERNAENAADTNAAEQVMRDRIVEERDPATDRSEEDTDDDLE